VKNNYPLPVISDFLDRVRGARIFTKLDLRRAYNVVRIKEGDAYKTASRTRYSQYEYHVVPCILKIASATFQLYIYESLWPYIDDFAVCYLDDVLIYSANEQEHEEHVRQVLQRLNEFGLYCKAEKCQFKVLEGGFLGLVNTPDGVGIESGRISIIEDWPTPISASNIQVLLGFRNFYRRCIRKYAKVTLPLMEYLKKPETSPSGKQRAHPAEWEWTRQAEVAFRKLKTSFTKAPILQHSHRAKPIILPTDLGGFAIAGILNQYHDFGELWPRNVYSENCS